VFNDLWEPIARVVQSDGAFHYYREHDVTPDSGVVAQHGISRPRALDIELGLADGDNTRMRIHRYEIDGLQRTDTPDAIDARNAQLARDDGAMNEHSARRSTMAHAKGTRWVLVGWIASQTSTSPSRNWSFPR